MEIFEFELPLLIKPEKPYWIKDLNMVIVPTAKETPISEYWGPQTLTKLILFDTSWELIKKRVTDFVIFNNFIHQNYHLSNWIHERALSDSNIYQKHISNLDDYIKENYSETKTYRIVDFDKYPLMEISQVPTEISFSYYFKKYSTLTDESKLKQLIDFFTYNSITNLITNKIYNNRYLQISNSFIIIETLINLEIKDKKDEYSCPSCKEKIPCKKSMNKLIEEYVMSKHFIPENQKLFITILKEHYKYRNNFFHGAKFYDLMKKLDEMHNKIGNQFSLNDEINYGDAAQTAPFIVNSFIRVELLNKL